MGTVRYMINVSERKILDKVDDLIESRRNLLKGQVEEFDVLN